MSSCWVSTPIFDGHDNDVHGVVAVDKDEHPQIPVLAGYAGVANAVANLVHSCWVREPDRRPSSMIGSTLVTSSESSPADEQYETASESTTTNIEEENVDDMIDVPLTGPGPVGYSTGKITGRATNTIPVPVNTVPVAVRVRYNRTYPRVVGSIGVVSVQERCPNLPSLHP